MGAGGIGLGPVPLLAAGLGMGAGGAALAVEAGTASRRPLQEEQRSLSVKFFFPQCGHVLGLAIEYPKSYKHSSRTRAGTVDSPSSRATYRRWYPPLATVY